MFGIIKSGNLEFYTKNINQNIPAVKVENYTALRLNMGPIIAPLRKVWVVREFNLRTQLKQQKLVVRRGTSRRKQFWLGNTLTVDRKKLTRYECRKGKWAFVRYRIFYLHGLHAQQYQKLNQALSIARKINPYRDDGIYPWLKRKKLCAPLNLDRFKPGKQKK